jgi:hypothetical protein
MKRAFLCIAACLVFVSAARADEFHLKDGTKIVGTIVGYGKDTFRVKTAYGYADIERSAIVSITVSNPEPETKGKPTDKTTKAKPEDMAKSNENAKTAESKEVASGKEAESGNKAELAAVNSPASSPVSAASPAATAVAAPKAAALPANMTAPATPPAAPPPPPPVREEVQGNVYINYTYGFQMYKPPDWDVIAGARAALPGSIVAMGTGDQTTYLIIGLVPASGTLQAQISATNDRLASSFEGYEPEKIYDATIAGLPAHDYEFHGAANGQEWTGTVALIQRGGNVFTILGVTSTNTDLVQIQQNVISRTIASLQFMATPTP